MIKLVVSDMDGTFLNSNGTFNHAYYQQVQALMKQQNVLFAACTGKQCERVEELFGPELSKDLWILGDSATRIKHNGQYIFESLLPNETGQQIIQTLETLASDHIIIACTPSAAFIKATTPNTEASIVRHSYARVKTLNTFTEITEDFVKITVYDPKSRCFENVKKLAKFADCANIVASEAAWIDISNFNIHKGTTLNKLQQLTNIQKEETIAFGDGFNDLDLFAEAGLSFATRNAFAEVKAQADFITKTNDENGVLVAVEKLLGMQGDRD